MEFSQKIKTRTLEQQNWIDPITDEKITNAVYHHIKPIERNGRSVQDNCAALNEKTHKHIHNDPRWKDMSWSDLLDNKEEIKKSILALSHNHDVVYPIDENIAQTAAAAP